MFALWESERSTSESCLALTSCVTQASNSNSLRSTYFKSARKIKWDITHEVPD